MERDDQSIEGQLKPLLSGPVLFDTMIIRHLCRAGASELLSRAFAGRMLWPEAVDTELRMQARRIKPLRDFLAGSPATVIECGLEDGEDEEIEKYRLDMYTLGAVQASDTEHLGEAQCLFVAERDGYPLATDDRRARERARGNCGPKGGPRRPGTHCVRVFHTVQVLYAIVRLGACRPGQAWRYYEKACDGEHGLYSPAGFEIVAGTRERFIATASELAGTRSAAEPVPDAGD